MTRTGTAVATVAFVGVGAAAVYWGPELIAGSREQTPTERCTVTQGDSAHTLTAEQANNAALIAAVGVRLGFDAAGVTVAIATAIQESSLRNLDYGDRDSLGLFQQRPSQGWGTIEQVTDPYYSTETFYMALLRVDGWESLAVTDAAQAVQRSGFPLAYADHEMEARAWAEAFTGAGGLVTCSVSGPETPAPQLLADRVAADFGTGAHAVDVLDREGDETILGIRPAVDTPEARAALAAWAVATASVTGLVWVEGDDVVVSLDGSHETVVDSDSDSGSADGYAGIKVAVAGA
ncbi:hypothetical protein LGT39_01215 [Demequina sp. TTPB684]|uniref:hypothetical protein n=1 Tax=unclassified Demequina TaxID=2620311 RepID=UPI001CF2A240|nr:MULTISPECIES: hypothetical protein [unclassified Demequina]MCB2411466.1 hypothetical protein [Demequina sp. TTPB684]UPU87294.1 hypothetical protein LGT36_008390 [Demequina sp. TMPB413]